MCSRPGPGQLSARSIRFTTLAPDSTTRPRAGRSPRNRSSGVCTRRSDSSCSSVKVNRAPSKSTASPNRPSSSRTPPSHSNRWIRVPRAGVIPLRAWAPTPAGVRYSERSTVSCGAFSANRERRSPSRAPRRLSETPIVALRRLSSPCDSSISAWRSWPTVIPSAAIERPLRSRCTTAWLSSRSVPILASVSRMPPRNRQRGRCRSPSVCSRAASSRGTEQSTIRMVVKRASGSSTSRSKRQPRSSTYGTTVPPARSSTPLIRTPTSFSDETRPASAGGPSSSSQHITRARTVRSGPHGCPPCGSSTTVSPLLRSYTLPLRKACHMPASAAVRSSGGSPPPGPTPWVTELPSSSHTRRFVPSYNR